MANIATHEKVLLPKHQRDGCYTNIRDTAILLKYCKLHIILNIMLFCYIENNIISIQYANFVHVAKRFLWKHALVKVQPIKETHCFCYRFHQFWPSVTPKLRSSFSNSIFYINETYLSLNVHISYVYFTFFIM